MVKDWIYFTQLNFDDSPLTVSLYKIRADGTDQTKLNDDQALFINVVDDWVYYANNIENHKIYKIRTGGSERTKLTQDDDILFNLNLVGEWIYAVSTGRAENLVMTKIDGSERALFSNLRYAYDINVADDWIYYNNIDDNSNIYKIRTGNTEQNKVNDDSSRFINVVGDWIYYSNYSDDGKYYRIRTDVSGRQKVN